ncbi:ABC-three component system middle component 6 [Escherichia coli]|uniref:ABC-three component system middle component 6 n=2 Tax=Escherichia coli TaxID=562 RepID=UPI00085409AA|nr:hypothetical protein [Escherichia coli]OEN85583.1 hypothetical protein BHF56_13540 [Escherichia coli]GCS19683.1 hypothetical protein BvCmsHHNP022_02037 [Escherichia coli]GDI36210.1 hypothetical protein BvCmsKSNP029_01688 [Escherichia coli]
MIISDITKPSQTLYYLGAQLLECMSSNAYSHVDIIELYNEFISKNNKPSFTQYIYTLNWLYLLGLVDANENGDLILCF